MGINSGYNGAFDRRGIAIRQRAQQDWTIGATVRVGFMSGLVVMEKSGPDYVLRSATGKWYAFTPHLGIAALDHRSQT